MIMNPKESNTGSSPPPPGLPTPRTTLNLYRRIAFGRKHLFKAPGVDAAGYFVVNPVPHKHAGTWRPVLYRGDNPKYTPSSTGLGRALRKSMWNSFEIQLGDGVDAVLRNKKREAARRSHARIQKWRRFWRLKPKEAPEEALEELEQVQGLVTAFKMRRKWFLMRTLTWQLDGREYRWSGTRSFLGRSLFARWKGVSQDLKLVDSSGNVLAMFEKDRWASYRRAEKLGVPPNKKRSLLGKLHLYSAPEALPKAADKPIPAVDPNISEKFAKGLNLQGPHLGDLTEDAIVFTCWIAVEAEHRLRYKIFDIMEEIAESFKE